MLYGIACGTRGWVYISNHSVGYDIPSLSARHCVSFGRSVSTFSAPPFPPHVCQLFLLVFLQMMALVRKKFLGGGDWTFFIEYWTILWGVVCVGVELAVVFVL